MKITFKWWSLWNGRNARVVYIGVNKDGYWSKRSQADLLSAMRGQKGIDVEEGETVKA